MQAFRPSRRNRFSLRRELFRITLDQGSNETWRQVLEAHKVPDLWKVEEFRRYCRPFAPEGMPQPGIVIPLSTTVTSGRRPVSCSRRPKDSTK